MNSVVGVDRPNRTYSVSKEIIERLYVHDHLSTTKAAKIVGCSRTQFRRYMDLFGIEARPLSSYRGEYASNYQGGKSITTFVCEQCGKTVTKSAPGHGLVNRYCSRQCAADVKKTRGTVQCGWCGKSFEVQRHAVETAKYCSKACKHHAQSGANAPNWTGGRYAPQKRLRFRISASINESFRSKGIVNRRRHWEEIVGYTLQELKAHLISTLPEGWGWSDFRDGRLHIDHVVPHSVFRFDSASDTEFSMCWRLENLQLLPASENIRKGNNVGPEWGNDTAYKHLLAFRRKQGVET